MIYIPLREASGHFRRDSKADSDYQPRHVRPPVCPRGTTRPQPDDFIFRIINKMC